MRPADRRTSFGAGDAAALLSSGRFIKRFMVLGCAFAVMSFACWFRLQHLQAEDSWQQCRDQNGNQVQGHGQQQAKTLLFQLFSC